MPDLDPTKWQLIIAKIEVNYQELWQHGEKCAPETTSMVHFNYKLQKSKKIPDDICAQLMLHFYNKE